MATNWMPNSNITTSPATDVWGVYGGSGSITATSEGGHFVTSAAGLSTYLSATTDYINDSKRPPFGFKYTLGNVMIRRNTAASGVPNRIEFAVNAGVPAQTTVKSYDLSGGAFPVGVWVQLPAIVNSDTFSNFSPDYPTLNYNAVRLYNSGSAAMDLTVKGFGMYKQAEYTSDYTSAVIDTSDATFTATVPSNSLTVPFKHSDNNEMVTLLKWDWGDGASNTYTGLAGRSPSHTYPKAGVYTATLTATNAWSQTVSTTQTLSVPTGTFTANYAYQANYTSLDVDASASVAPSTDPVSSYTWVWGDGTANGSGVTANHVYAAPAIYTVKLTTATTGTKRSSSSSKSIAITTPPNPDNYFTVVKDKLTVTFSPSISNGTSYAWSFGDGSTDTTQNPVHTFATSDTYAVTLTVNGTLTVTQNVIVTSTYTPLSIADSLRLEVAVPYPAGTLYNRLHNPSGELGAYAWATPVAGSTIVGSSTSNTTIDKGVAGAKLVYRSGGSVAQYFTSEAVRVVASQYAAAQWLSPYLDGYIRGSVEALNASGAVIGTSAVTGYFQGSTTLTRRTTPYLLPAGTVTARLKIQHTSDTGSGIPAINKIVQVRRAMLATAATSAALSSLPYSEYSNWVDVLGPTHEINIDREALNVGTFSATILDASLDPSVSDTIQAGQSVRVRVQTVDDQGNSVWQSLYTGSLTGVTVSYEKDFTDDPKKTRITLSATDNISTLATSAEIRGVAGIVDLPALLEGVAVPFEINGSSGQIGTVQVVASNDNASVLDQIAVTRDNNSGYAFVDRDNVLIARDPQSMPTVAAGLVDESAYSSVDANFSTSNCMNSITVMWQRYNAITGETTEIPYGPYVDNASIDRYGLHTAEFKRQGGVESGTAIATWANAVLAANSVPQRLINSVTIPIRYVEDLHTGKALLDMYDLVHQKYDRIGSDKNVRVTSIRHSITPKRWEMQLGFDVDGAVASPQVTPAPVTGSAVTTITGTSPGVVWSTDWNQFDTGNNRLEYKRVGNVHTLAGAIRRTGATVTLGTTTQVCDLSAAANYQPPALTLSEMSVSNINGNAIRVLVESTGLIRIQKMPNSSSWSFTTLEFFPFALTWIA